MQFSASETEARGKLESTRSVSVRGYAVTKGHAECSDRSYCHGSSHRRGRRCRTGIVCRAVVLIEVGVVENVEAFAKQLQRVSFIDMEYPGQTHIDGVVCISGVVIPGYIRRQTGAALSEQIEAEGLPLLSIRRAERNASDDERSCWKRPTRLRSENLRDLPIANDPTGD